MKSLLEDLYRLRWGLALFLVLAVAGIAVALLAQQLATGARKAERLAGAQVAELQGKLSRARDEAEEIRGKIARYRDLADRGVIGQEARLDWVEKIAKIKTARRLFEVRYELEAQKPADPAILPGGNAAGPFEFMSSSMKLHMLLLHEDDLLGFLSDLRQSVAAILVVRRCDVSRLPRNSGERNLQPQLAADCEIDWITAREKQQ